VIAVASPPPRHARASAGRHAAAAAARRARAARRALPHRRRAFPVQLARARAPVGPQLAAEPGYAHVVRALEVRREVGRTQRAGLAHRRQLAAALDDIRDKVLGEARQLRLQLRRQLEALGGVKGRPRQGVTGSVGGQL
jgi:hypothetical protein